MYKQTAPDFSGAADPNVPATGDESNILLWGTLLCMSAVGIAVLVPESKKRLRAR